MSKDLSTVSSAPGAAAGTAATIFSPEGLNQLLKFAEVMSRSVATVPKHLAGQPADCLAVTMQAAQWGMNPFAVAQKTHIVNGTLGYEAQLVNAVVSSSNLLTSRLNYEWGGDWSKVNGKTDKSPGLTVTVSATIKGEIEPRSLTISMAQAGVRNSPLWEQDPKQQLAYLCTKRWARLHAPDVLLGVYTPDELSEQPRVERDITPARTGASLNDVINGVGQSDSQPDTDKVEAEYLAQIAAADNCEKAAAIRSALEEDKENLGFALFKSLKQKAVARYHQIDAYNGITASINSLDVADPEAKAHFAKAEKLLKDSEQKLGKALFDGFTTTMNDLRPEFQ